MSKDQVSIITPAYNSAAYIAETIASVRAQTHENWEMIIADDGSTDDTIVTAQQAAAGEPRIHIKSFPHAGLPAISRNRALGHANGRYIAFLDSDDLWEPRKLETQLASFTNTGKRWGFSNMLRFGAEDGLNYDHNWHPTRPFFDELLTGNGIPCLTIITEKALLATVCDNNDISRTFDESERLKVGEDWDLALRLSQQSEPDYLSESLARYRIHTQGISRSFETNYDCAMALIDKYRSAGTSEHLLRQARDWHKSKLAINHLLHTRSAWRADLISSTARHVTSLRNIFFATLTLLPRTLAQKVYYTALSNTKPRG